MVKRIEFYDVKNKKKFTTSKYTIRILNTIRGKRKQAVTRSPYAGKIKVTKFVALDFKK